VTPETDGPAAPGGVGGDQVGPIREEAERLVATALAAVSIASATLRMGAGPGCRCPLCRMVGALRDPDPRFAERLATGAGDVATGVAGALRTVAGVLAPDRDA
jgi:hypothetical protein